MSKTKSQKPYVAAMTGESLARFLYTFATMKYISTQSKNVERRDAFTVVGPTSIGLTDFKFDSPQVIAAIGHEYQNQWTRLEQYVERAKPGDEVDAFYRWIENAKKHCRQFQQSYSQRLVELNRTNATMARYLGFGARSAAVGQAAAEIALTLCGLGFVQGTAVKVVASQSGKMILGEFVTGVGTSSAITAAETWSQTRRCDAAMVIVPEAVASEGSKASPGSWGANLKKVGEAASKRLLDEAAKHRNAVNLCENMADNYKSVRGRPLPNNLRRTLASKALHHTQKAQQKTSMANSGSQGASALTFVGYLIAVKTTHSSLTKMVDHWNFKL